ncbi:MAG TPA: DUF115 domain-containing protein [Burkholderiaceae bacterium]|nr:DUF115 domain-containing protein [Burkholderiaceae bacterium]
MKQSEELGWIGHAPTVTIAPAVRTSAPDAERSKYERVWGRDEYRQVSPGESVAPMFVAQAHLKPGARVIDFGTGTGRGALMIALLGGAHVTMLDFADNCLDDDVRNALTTQSHALEFRRADLREPIAVAAPYGFCADVMEHIEPADVDRVLSNILHAAQHVFFQISCIPDKLGALIGEPLHLTVQPYEWWAEKFRALGAVVHWSAGYITHCCFYVTAWASGRDVVDAGMLNVSAEQVAAQVRRNIGDGWAQVTPHLTQETEVALLCGGPSLAGQLGEIRRLKAAGAKIVTVNGAYQWALEQGLQVGAQIVVDARDSNARFTHPVADETKYLIASQCHPSVLDGLPRDRTLLWHTTAESIREILDELLPQWWGIPGGSTVVLRAIPLLRLLGYYRFHLFGFDSCYQGDAHHAYAQPENERDTAIDITCGERMFRCAPWMVSQAQEFMDLVRFLGDEIELEVYGDGLIAHILRTGADLSEEK